MPSSRKIMLLTLFVALLALLVAPMAAAQTDVETIKLGDTVNGTLEAGHLSAQYVFAGHRGDVVTVALESTAFDGYLTLLDPGLNEVATDDDSGGSSNPSIIDYTLTTSGDFTIVVDSYNRLQTGDFRLSLTGTAAPESTETPETATHTPTTSEGSPIAMGDRVTGRVSADAEGVAYTFDGQAGQQVTIELTSSDFDAYLKLQDSSGAVVAEDDDSAGNLNARIEDFELPSDDTYSIVAGSYGGGVEGEFTLSLTSSGQTVQPTFEATGTPQATPTLIPTPVTTTTAVMVDAPYIKIGDTVSDTIADFEGSKYYNFVGHEGETVTIRAESDAFDTYLQLLDADGGVIAEDDDSAGNLNAEIQDFVLPVDGTFTIGVGSFSGAASGDFRLSLTAEGVVSEPTPTATPGPDVTPTAGGAEFVTSPGVIEVGQGINSTLPDDTRSAIFTFEGQAGQVVTITMTSTDFDSYVSLKDSSGREIAWDDDSGGNLNAVIENVTLPDDDTYTIQATSFGSFVTGRFSLALEGSTVATPVASNGGEIALGDTVGGELTQGGSTAAYTFEGEAGQSVTFTLESSEFDAYLSLQGPDGDEIASDDDSAGSLNARIADFSLPDDGTYTLVVSGANGFSTGDFTLRTEVGGTAVVTPTATPTAVANTTGTINIGETVDGTLTDGPATFTFEGEAGQVITIEADSTAFDAYVQLKDANGIELASDDDSAGNLNAAIEDFTLPADDTYSIIVSSFDNTATGNFSVSLSENGGVTVTPVPPTEVPSGSEIEIGDTVNGTLSSGSLTASYTFEGEAGQIVTITASSEDFDSYMRLKDSSGEELITDDDSAGNLDSRIAFFALPDTDTYTIVVESFDSAGGSYTLSLTEAEVQPIEYTQIINGELTATQNTAGYRFTGAAGDVVSITLRSSDFDAYLSLNQADSSSSYALMTDDDSAGGSDARIGPYTLPETGEYIITVSSYDSTATGDYTLTLDRATLEPIDFDEPVTAEFDAEHSTLYYSFEGATGDVIDIEANSGSSVDTSMSLTGPDNYQIASDDDSGKGFDPEISHLVLTSDGTYTIALSAYSEGDSGTVTLTLTRAPLRSLDDGPQEVRLNDKVTEDVLTFTGAAGEHYELWVEVRDGTASPNVTLTQDGKTVATGSSSTATKLVVAFIVPDDGQVTVQITDYSYAKVVLDVRLEAGE